MRYPILILAAIFTLASCSSDHLPPKPAPSTHEPPAATNDQRIPAAMPAHEVMIASLRAAGLEPIKSVSVNANRAWVVNGKPFLPITGWLQDPNGLPKIKAAGMNTMAGYWRPPAGQKGDTSGADEYALKAAEAGLYFLPPFEPQFMTEMQALKGSPVLLGWMHSDEPDMPKTTTAAADGSKHKAPRESPDEVMAKFRQLKAFDPSRPILMTVTDFFIHDHNFDNWWTRPQQDEVYPEMLKAADVVGFDVYPIFGWNQPKKIGWVSQGLTDLRQYAGMNKPVYEWIETQSGGKFKDKASPVTGIEIRNEVWQAIIRGATAIGYFTHQFQPTFSGFGAPPENQAAMKEINDQLTRLTNAILAPDAPNQPTIEIAGGAAAQLLAKNYAGYLWIFTQNIDGESRAGQATITLQNLKPNTPIEVVDENRTLIAQPGHFTDTFPRLAVHVYRVKM